MNNMPRYLVEGKCLRCGLCCKTLMRMSYMLQYPNPGNPDNWCKYLFEKGGVWGCEIREAYETGDEEFLLMIPSRELEYFHEECRDYPNPENPAHMPPRHEFVEGCGYKARLVEE